MVRFVHTYGVFLGVAVTFFPLALLVSLAARARSVFEAATTTAEKLNLLVTQREQEILAGMQQLQRREREALLLEERSRIMRDMHDGIGGQLLGLVVQARADRLSGQALVKGLEESLDDLRLVVGSLEQGEGTLATALGAFRARIEPRCEAAGATLVWRIEEVGPTPQFGPDKTLQVYRILQEACTNALKHGRPDRIEITLQRRTDGAIELALADNGKGFDVKARSAGRGLANMRYRAQQIGAKLAVRSGAEGTRVALEL
jgi:signal transduction histidine kinase